MNHLSANVFYLITIQIPRWWDRCNIRLCYVCFHPASTSTWLYDIYKGLSCYWMQYGRSALRIYVYTCLYTFPFVSLALREKLWQLQHGFMTWNDNWKMQPCLRWYRFPIVLEWATLDRSRWSGTKGMHITCHAQWVLLLCSFYNPQSRASNISKTPPQCASTFSCMHSFKPFLQQNTNHGRLRYTSCFPRGQFWCRDTSFFWIDVERWNLNYPHIQGKWSMKSNQCLQVLNYSGHRSPQIG